MPELSLPRHENVVVKGIRLHYLDWGYDDRTRRPFLLFLHGTGLTAHSWDLICLAMRDVARCVAVDLRGHGDSEWSKALEYGPNDHASDIGDLTEAIGEDRVIIVGASLGGLIAARYAQVTEPVGLVIIDTGPVLEAAGPRRTRAFMGRQVFRSLDDCLSYSLAFNPKRDPAILRTNLLHSMLRLPDGTWTWKYDSRYYGKQPPSWHREERVAIWSSIDRIQCPTLVVRGAQSELLSADAAQEFASALTEGSFVEISNAGHNIHGDNPYDLLIELRRFVARINSP